MKHRITYLTSLPENYPATGLKLRMDQLIAAMTQIEGVELDVWRPSPGPDSGGGASRNGLAAAGVDLVTAGLALAASYLPRPVAPSVEEDIFARLHRFDPAIVLAHHDTFTGLTPRLLREGFRIVIDTHNVESAVARQALRLAKTPRQFAAAASQWAVTLQREKKLLPLATEIWTPSANDAAGFRALFGERVPIAVVPNVVDVRRYTPTDTAEKHVLGFFGDFAYPPNSAAAECLLQDILPALRRRDPAAQLYLVGRNPSPELRRLAAETTRAVVTGSVPDTRPWMERCAVHVAPIEHGSGTRLKILEGLAMSKPMVTTPKGCEGLDVRDEEHLLIRPIAGFPEAILSLFSDQGRAQQMGQRGRSLVAERYSLQSLTVTVAERLEYLLGHNLRSSAAHGA